VDSRTPVIVGIGELKLDEPGPDPARMMADAAELALTEAGGVRPRAIAAAPPAAWGDGNPAARVAELLGMADVRTLRSSMQGGNGPQLLVNTLAREIAAGQLEAAIVCGAEALASVVKGASGDWPAPDPEREAEVVEGEAAPNTDAETAVGMIAPIMAYPLIENALMRAAGRTYAEQMDHIAGLWSRFSAVAATQECAWTPREYSAEELKSDEGNRRVSLPYRKLLNSNIQVDQAAALVLCSAGAAESAGVPREQWVFVHGGAAATDEWFLSHRRDLHRSPAIAACGRALGIDDDVAHVDLYSCFPSAVQLGAQELGLSIDRQLTQTGGLTFFGGPGNNYATHGIAAVVRALRAGDPGETGLATALGWYATKHALGLYGNEPPESPYVMHEPDPELPDPRRVLDPGDHVATAETATVIYERDGSASYGILFALTDEGDRVLGQTRDPDVMAFMATDDFPGARVRVRPDRQFEVAA
jgi:acetyl-CoA C-acetyltransferase